MRHRVFRRSSGVLLHPTSLPGKQGIGTFGKEAKQFLDFLTQAGQTLWQMCPLGPTGFGDSPYQCFSAYAGNPLLIDLENLVSRNWLRQTDLHALASLPEDRVDFGALIPIKRSILKKAFAAFESELNGTHWTGKTLAGQFESFKQKNGTWLPGYVLFMALKTSFGGASWDTWPREYKQRNLKSLVSARSELADEIRYEEFLQFIFFEQWIGLKAYAHQRGIRVIGDMPIFVAYDSADVWNNPELFLLDDAGRPTHVAGVPPDYFSTSGQLWGNPLYDWDAMKRQEYSWWISVLRSKLSMYDIIRIDHFRGFAAYWAVPFGETTAINGSWEPAPGYELFSAVQDQLGTIPIIAEDLGLITPDVQNLITRFGFPGMKVLQFAFDSNEENDHLPHNYHSNSIVYTGTHDNDTVQGWFFQAKETDRHFALSYMHARDASEIHWEFIRSALASVPDCAIIPLQDIFGLGAEARMNTPGTFGQNWTWRYSKNALKIRVAEKLRSLTALYGRI